MNWYKKSSRIRNTFRRIVDDYEDDGICIWTKGNDVFVSFKDGAMNREEALHDIRRFVQDTGKVEWDYEVGHPGAGWIEV